MVFSNNLLVTYELIITARWSKEFPLVSNAKSREHSMPPRSTNNITSSLKTALYISNYTNRMRHRKGHSKDNAMKVLDTRLSTSDQKST